MKSSRGLKTQNGYFNLKTLQLYQHKVGLRYDTLIHFDFFEIIVTVI